MTRAELFTWLSENYDLTECEHGFRLYDGHTCPNEDCERQMLRWVRDAVYQPTPIETIKHQLTLPVVRDEDGTFVDERFDPWEAFPAFYGSYSSDFDDMAILVLENIRDNKWGADHGEGLAHQMFREVLCTADLCDYGTSPRGCFPNWGSGFEDILPALIEKWRAYRDAQWQDDAQ